MRLKIQVFAIITFAFPLVGAVATPTLEDLNRALSRAKEAWRYDMADMIDLRLVPLNTCDLKNNPDVAILQIVDSQTTITFEGGEGNRMDHSYSYILLVNSACDWSRIDLDSVISHEYGHILTGPDHSMDLASVMYWTRVGAKSGQRVTQADRNKVKTGQRPMLATLLATSELR